MTKPVQGDMYMAEGPHDHANAQCGLRDAMIAFVVRVRGMLMATFRGMIRVTGRSRVIKQAL